MRNKVLKKLLMIAMAVTMISGEIKQITTDENVIKIVEEYGLNSGYNPFEYTLCTSETEDVPDNGVDWDDCMVQDYIDFKRKGIIPGFYKEEYEVWLKNNNQK